MSEAPIRVAMIGQKGYPPVHGGIEKHVAELAARLAPRGVEITIYSRPHYSDANGPTAMPGITVRRLPSVPTKHLDAITHTLAATADAVRHGYDIVHYHALGPALLSGVPRWLRRGRTVVTVHGLDWQRDKWGPVAAAVLRGGEGASARFPDGLIVVSQALRQHYAARYGRAAVCIPNGIGEPVRRPRQELDRLGLADGFVLFVGRFVPEKGCHLLLEAYGKLPAELRARHRLVMAGGSGFTDDYAAGLRAAAAPEVLFPGYVHGRLLEELYSHAALVVLPSTLEGLSIALLEGMSYGRCCLVSDIAPNLEVSGGCAPAFASGDAGALGAAMAGLLGDPAARERHGEASRRRVLATYSWENAAVDTLALYRRVLGREKSV